MRYKINGADFVPLGANMIPMEEMEGRQDARAFLAQLQSAVDVHMNALRVWGGGVFLPDVFYDTCDELGITIPLHDMMVWMNRGSWN